MKSIRKRRMQRKTDYKSRLALIKSGKRRLVIRKTNTSIFVQIVETDIVQDKVLIGINSKILLSKGWPKESKGSLKNMVAAYLTGFLLGKMAKEKKIDSAILDSGMHRNIHKSRIYSALKGILDSGIKVSHNPEILPTEKELKSNEKFFPLINKIKEKA